MTSAHDDRTRGNSGDDAPPPPFDPVAHGLPADFLLTDYTRLKGCSCKLPQPKLLALLRDANATRRHHGSDNDGGSDVVGVSDCSVVPLHRRDGDGDALYLVSTTDFFFPSVEDPYVQGQIGAANVLSDLYSMGISDCDTVLMLLAASTDMDERERDVTTRAMVRGFHERVRAAGAAVTGGQTVLNPWPLIGGVAMRVATARELVMPRMRDGDGDVVFGNATGLTAGDVLVLTKPLGTQVAVNLRQWLHRPSPLYLACVHGRLDAREVDALYDAAVRSMVRLNRHAARLMHVCGAHAATDVTGFGILGHAANMAANANSAVAAAAAATQGGGDNNDDAVATHARRVRIVLTRLPIFATAVTASRLIDDKYRLLTGHSAETSGGLLVAFGDMAAAQRYMDALRDADDGQPSWVVGHVVSCSEGNDDGDAPGAVLADDCEIVEV